MKKHFNNIKRLLISKKILLILGVLIIFAICIFVVNYIQLWMVYDVNRKTVDTFLVHLSSSDYKKAYAIFANKYKNEEDFDTFKNSVYYGKEAYVGYKKDSFLPTRTTRFLLPLDPPLVRYIGNISYKDGRKSEITTIFIWENNEWKLYLIEFN